MTNLSVASRKVGKPPCLTDLSCSPPIEIKMSNPEHPPERFSKELTSEERAKITIKAAVDTCSLAISEIPKGLFKHVRFGEMIWEAFELGRIYESNRAKNEE